MGEVSTHLVDGEGQFGGCTLVDVDRAALRRVTLHDGKNLQVTGGRGQVEVGQPGLFQVVEVSLRQSVPEKQEGDQFTLKTLLQRCWNSQYITTSVLCPESSSLVRKVPTH